MLKDLSDNTGLGAEDKALISLMISLLDLVAHPQSGDHQVTWAQAHEKLVSNPYDILHKLKSFSDNADSASFAPKDVEDLKTLFVDVQTKSSSHALGPIVDFMTEAFCYLDILSEIELQNSP